MVWYSSVFRPSQAFIDSCVCVNLIMHRGSNQQRLRMLRRSPTFVVIVEALTKLLTTWCGFSALAIAEISLDLRQNL